MKAAAQVFVRVHATDPSSSEGQGACAFWKQEGNAFWRDLKGGFGGVFGGIGSYSFMGSRPLTAFAAYRQEWKEIIENFVELKLFLTFSCFVYSFRVRRKASSTLRH